MEDFDVLDFYEDLVKNTVIIFVLIIFRSILSMKLFLICFVRQRFSIL